MSSFDELLRKSKTRLTLLIDSSAAEDGYLLILYKQVQIALNEHQKVLVVKGYKSNEKINEGLKAAGATLDEIRTQVSIISVSDIDILMQKGGEEKDGLKSNQYSMSSVSSSALIDQLEKHLSQATLDSPLFLVIEDILAVCDSFENDIEFFRFMSFLMNTSLSMYNKVFITIRFVPQADRGLKRSSNMNAEITCQEYLQELSTYTIHVTELQTARSKDIDGRVTFSPMTNVLIPRNVESSSMPVAPSSSQFDLKVHDWVKPGPISTLYKIAFDGSVKLASPLMTS
jgi:hypothetical protein